MTEYRLRWEIDIEAATPQEAAEKARACQLRPETTATVFDVFATEEGGIRVAHIDLTYPEESEHFTMDDVLNGHQR